MSKITNDGLTRSGSGCFMTVTTATVSVKGLNRFFVRYLKIAAEGCEIFNSLSLICDEITITDVADRDRDK